MTRPVPLSVPSPAPAPCVRRGVSRLALGLVLVLMAALSPASAGAAGGAGTSLIEPYAAAAAYDEAIGLEEAVRRVRERTGGRVLRAETRRENGRVVHRIRVLSPDGRVRTWSVDAETGRMS